MDNNNDMNPNDNLLLSDLFLWDNTNNQNSVPMSSSTTSTSLLDEAFLFGEPSLLISNTQNDFLDLFPQGKDFFLNSNDLNIVLHHDMHDNNNNGLVVKPLTDLKPKTPSSSTQRKRKAAIDELSIDKKKPKRKRKKKAVVNVDPNASPKPKRITGLNKPLMLSASLQTIMDGATQLSRPEIVQRLWRYIKSNQLQDPADRRFILCDARLKNIFQQDRVNSFGMNKDLNAHLTKIETTSATVPPIQAEDVSPQTPDIMIPRDTEACKNGTISSD